MGHNRLLVAWAAAVLPVLLAQQALAWTAPLNISSQTTGHRAWGPQAARDPLGNTHVVWTGGSDPSSNWQVWYQVFDGASWTSPVALSGMNGTRPHIAVDGNGKIHVVYEEDAEDSIWYRSKPVGGSWSAPINLHTGGRSISPHIAVNPAGDRIVVAWHEDYQVGGEWDIFVNIFNGTGWSGTANVSVNSQLSSEARVCIDTQGNMHVAWTDAQETIRHRIRDGSGNWGTIRTVFTTPDRVVLGSICASPDGFVHAAYSYDNGSSDWRIWHKYFNGNWSGGTIVYSHGAQDDDVAPVVYADEYSRLHMFFSNNAPSNNKIHYTRAASVSSAWEPVTTLLTGWYGATNVAFTIDTSMTARAFWQGKTISANPWNIWVSSQSVGTPPPQGMLAGYCRDQWSNPLPGVTVSTGNAAGITDAAGHYAFPVPAGTYTVNATRPYFTGDSAAGVTVAQGQTTTRDFQLASIPPGPVTDFVVASDNERNVLTWTNPDDGQFAGAVIRMRTDGVYPGGPTDGTLVADIAGHPGSAGQHSHEGLTNGTTYRYAVFAYDSYVPRSYAVALTAAGTPAGPCDFDRDGDVDQADFGRFQSCLTGDFNPQPEPACGGALLDDDSDVDETDTALFIGCFSGPGTYADPDCLP